MSTIRRAEIFGQARGKGEDMSPHQLLCLANSRNTNTFDDLKKSVASSKTKQSDIVNDSHDALAI